MNHWKDILISPDTTLLQAIKVIDSAGMRAALVVNEGQKLLGMLTDGDIRRCILKNINLEEPVSKYMNTSPTVADEGDNREKILSQLQSLSIYHLPVLDQHRKVVGFETLDRLLALQKKDNIVVIMAGGMGKRLQPLTIDCPKPLIKIGDKPVLEILLVNLIKSGFHLFYFAVNYKSEMIKNYFEMGEKWGVEIRYIEEKKRLGTAGALSFLPKNLQHALLVINADVITNIDFQSLLQYHTQSQADATLCIRQHEQIVPYGVVQRDEETHHLLTIVEKPIRQFFVNAGIYILEPCILNMIEENTFCDMPDLLTNCVKHHYKVITFPIREYWLDIGRPEDLERAHLDYEKVF